MQDKILTSKKDFLLAIDHKASIEIEKSHILL